MINKYKIIGVFIVLSSLLFSQQDYINSLYVFNKSMINPGFAGSSNWAIFTGGFRVQNMSLPKKTTIQNANFHAPIQSKHIGLGFKISSEKSGLQTNNIIMGQFSYHLNFMKGKLSAGLESGLYSRTVDFQKLTPYDLNDNALPLTNTKASMIDLSSGLYYSRKQFYAGYSCYHLLSDRIRYNNYSQGTLVKQHYIILGNVFFLGKNFELETTSLLRLYKGSGINFDIFNMLYYLNKVGVGVVYRSFTSVTPCLRVIINEKIKIGYSYDYYTSKLSKYAGGAHEIVLSYGIKLPPPPTKKEIHPRYYF